MENNAAATSSGTIMHKSASLGLYVLLEVHQNFHPPETWVSRVLLYSGEFLVVRMIDWSVTPPVNLAPTLLIRSTSTPPFILWHSSCQWNNILILNTIHLEQVSCQGYFTDIPTNSGNLRFNAGFTFTS